MTLNKLLAGTLVLQILVLGTLIAAPAETRSQPASAQQSEPNCQYPDRWSNPPGGCDNSDPAVPECIKEFSTKAGEDACIAAFVAAHEPPKPIETVSLAQPQPAQCGGK